jgi:hypothetical protein
MVAIDHNNEAVAEVLYAAAASDGTLDLEMQVVGRGQGGGRGSETGVGR